MPEFTCSKAFKHGFLVGSSDLLRIESHAGVGQAGGFRILPYRPVLGSSQGKLCSKVDIYMKIQISISPKTMVSRGF